MILENYGVRRMLKEFCIEYKDFIEFVIIDGERMGCELSSFRL